LTSSCVNHSSLHGNLIILHPFILSSLYPPIFILYIHPFIPSSLNFIFIYILHPLIYKYPSSLPIHISFICIYPSSLYIHISFIPLYTHILHLQISFILASLASCIYLSCNVYCLGKKILSSDFFNFLIFATGSRGPFIFQTMNSVVR